MTPDGALLVSASDTFIYLCSRSRLQGARASTPTTASAPPTLLPEGVRPTSLRRQAARTITRLDYAGARARAAALRPPSTSPSASAAPVWAPPPTPHTSGAAAPLISARPYESCPGSHFHPFPTDLVPLRSRVKSSVHQRHTYASTTIFPSFRTAMQPSNGGTSGCGRPARAGVLHSPQPGGTAQPLVA